MIVPDAAARAAQAARPSRRPVRQTRSFKARSSAPVLDRGSLAVALEDVEDVVVIALPAVTTTS